MDRVKTHSYLSIDTVPHCARFRCPICSLSNEPTWYVSFFKKYIINLQPVLQNIAHVKECFGEPIWKGLLRFDLALPLKSSRFNSFRCYDEREALFAVLLLVSRKLERTSAHARWLKYLKAIFLKKGAKNSVFCTKFVDNFPMQLLTVYEQLCICRYRISRNSEFFCSYLI